jgi:hypothetical protein
MAVELDGNVRMRGDTGPGVGVRVVAEERRIRIVSGNELVGDWDVSQIGIIALHDGFNIKAEGEEFILRTEDDVAFAEEIGIVAASPRLARRLAARHNPEDPDPTPDPPVISSNLAAIGFALAGALVVAGGAFLDAAGTEGAPVPQVASTAGEGFDFWLAFIVGGVLMIAVAYVMSLGARSARLLATLVLLAVIVVFGLAVGTFDADTGELTAYGFIAGGLVVGVAVLFSGSLRPPD